MSIIPELLLQRAIVNGFRNLRKDPRLLDTLFKNLTQEDLAGAKSFILDTSIQFSINYPRQDLKVPALVLVLKNEIESIPFLGDNMTTHTLGHPTPDVDLSYDTLGGHGASTSDLSGLSVKLNDEPIAVDGSTGGRIDFSEDQTELIEQLYEEPPGCAFVYVVKGTGAGQVYPVTRILSNSLDIKGTFSTQLDSTSLVDLRLPPNDPELTLGEPSRVYDASSSDFRRLGAEYEVTYHLNILAGGQQEVVFLYSVIKALLISQRPLLEAQGIIALKVSGSDFAPKTDYLPSETFQRMMVLTFTYPFSFLQELDTPDQFQFQVSVTDPDTLEPCTTETVFSPIIVL